MFIVIDKLIYKLCESQNERQDLRYSTRGEAREGVFYYYINLLLITFVS